mmetsp:Transcript_14682/g.14304  ORF Transcript_14682/g.14304 Transcript_14682/m.14304 type:complete len:96 (+) Transcript_14682:2189-2476(+)
MSCYDIDQNKEDTLIYEMPELQGNRADYQLVEVQFMKAIKRGKGTTGETIHRHILPRLDYFHNDMTLLEVKKYIFEKIKPVYKGEPKMDDEEILN